MAKSRIGRRFKRRFSKGGSRDRGATDHKRRDELKIADTTRWLVDRAGGARQTKSGGREEEVKSKFGDAVGSWHRPSNTSPFLSILASSSPPPPPFFFFTSIFSASVPLRGSILRCGGASRCFSAAFGQQ